MCFNVNALIYPYRSPLTPSTHLLKGNLQNSTVLFHSFLFYCLGDHGTSSGGLVLPVGRKLSRSSVVTSQSVNSGFNQNQSEFGVLVLSVSLQMLAYLDSLLDEHVKILRNFRCESIGLEDTDNLLTCDGLDLSDTIGVTQNDTNLRRGQTLLGKLAYMFLDIGGRDLAPRRRSALVRQGTLRDTLSGSMHTTHAEKRESDGVRRDVKINIVPVIPTAGGRDDRGNPCAEGSNFSSLL